jgi:hypothetical protein
MSGDRCEVANGGGRVGDVTDKGERWSGRQVLVGGESSKRRW